MTDYKPKKSFGQNFLKDEQVLSQIAQAACQMRPYPSTRIYEIGAGLGALTRQILDKSAFVSAIERDRDLIPILRKTFQAELASGQLVLHEANAVTFLKTIVENPFVLCGNLPYHLSASILFETLYLAPKISGAVYLLQKEVAERIASGPNKKSYGLLSVLMQSQFDLQIIQTVSKQAFWPVPKIDSCVIAFQSKITPSKAPVESFVLLVKTAFSQRRKKLVNALENYENIGETLEKLGFDSNIRAENLSFQDYERILACL